MNNCVFINSNLITNFKPTLLNNFNQFNFFKKNRTQIFCKNFFLYILLLKYKKSLFKKSNIFIKKNKRKVFTILRSPYRHKLARHQIALNRYFINFSLKIELKNKIKLNDWNNLIKLINFLKAFNNSFESNIIFINSFWFSIPIFFNNNFIFKKFNNFNNK